MLLGSVIVNVGTPLPYIEPGSYILTSKTFWFATPALPLAFAPIFAFNTFVAPVPPCIATKFGSLSLSTKLIAFSPLCMCYLKYKQSANIHRIHCMPQYLCQLL